MDADGNGRISKDEYRGYFQRQVAAKVETLIAAKSGEANRGRDSKAIAKPATPASGTNLPEWFATLDSNKDGQISLFEWRQGDRGVEVFQEMDLDGDGLLTREEYQRFAKLQLIEEKQKKREERSRRPEATRKHDQGQDEDPDAVGFILAFGVLRNQFE